MDSFVLMGEGMLDRLRAEMGDDFCGSWDDGFHDDDDCDLVEEDEGVDVMGKISHLLI